MPDWLESTVPGQAATPTLLAWRIGVALLLGVAVSGLYRWARRGRSIEPTFVTTLILLATTIAMATQVIGDNVARAFSLVGALSVVRFRTVVKDTQDTAFVILAVVMGMGSGSGHLAVAMVGLVIVSVAALVLWPIGKADSWRVSEAVLTIRLGSGEAIRSATASLIAASTVRADLLAAKTARQGSLLVLSYRLRLKPATSPASLVAALKQVEGVKSVALRRAT